MLVTLTRYDGRFIAVNPAFVRAVAPHAQKPTEFTRVIWGKEDVVTVKGECSAVRDQLNAAMR